DHRTSRFSSVMKISESVSEARAKMQERCRRLAGHAGVAVRRSGTHTLEQAQHAATARDLIEGRDKVHFRCARVHETELDPIRRECPQQSLCASHSIQTNGSHCGTCFSLSEEPDKMVPLQLRETSIGTEYLE